MSSRMMILKVAALTQIVLGLKLLLMKKLYHMQRSSNIPNLPNQSNLKNLIIILLKNLEKNLLNLIEFHHLKKYQLSCLMLHFCQITNIVHFVKTMVKKNQYIEHILLKMN
uniref:ACYPI24752 protein n=1 Tax=Acyrthosiphon pisum TaxID=7029 RepID=C4WVX9_ACYPI|nr:ACYPI24752 [Acyrthosiphon pisum]